MAGGRPPIYDSENPDDIEKLDSLVDDYFLWIRGVKKPDSDDWIREPEPPTVTGLTLHIGFCDKSSLYDYSKKPEFSHSIKRGLAQIEKYHEIRASYGDKCTGNIFVLKNFGWKDKIEQDIKQSTDITWNENKTYDE